MRKKHKEKLGKNENEKKVLGKDGKKVQNEE